MNTKINEVVVFSSYDTNTFFISKSHTQHHNLGDDFVPTTHYLPSNVKPRECLPDGIIKNINDVLNVFYSDMQQIAQNRC